MIFNQVDKIAAMRQGGRVGTLIVNELLTLAKPGITTLELDEKAEELTLSYGMKPSFKGYEGYRHSLVTCINEEVVHGIPGPRELVDNDLLTLDFGVHNQGFNIDMARTKIVGTSVDPLRQKIVATGELAVRLAIAQAIAGNRVGDLSFAMQSVVEAAGFQAVRAFVGHGVGRELHEEPQIPCYGSPHTGEILQEGMTLAVEIMFTVGSYKVKIMPDGWTAVTADGSLAGMYEETILVTNSQPEILTRA